MSRVYVGLRSLGKLLNLIGGQRDVVKPNALSCTNHHVYAVVRASDVGHMHLERAREALGNAA